MTREARVSCPGCGRAIRIDAGRLPDRVVSFRCPGCQGKVVVDPGRLVTPVREPEGQESTGGEPAPPRTAPPDSGDQPVAAAPPEVALPPGEELPPGLLVARSADAAATLGAALREHGCQLEVVEDGDAAQQWMRDRDVPALILWAADSVDRPPLDEMRPVLNLPPGDRRRTFVVLMATNLKSGDGLAAFLYQVNLVLSSRDVASAPGLVYSALDFHRRLYRPMLAALED